DGSRCCATSMEETAKAVLNPRVHRISGAAWQAKISDRWRSSTALGKRQKITRGPKPVSKKSNSMWMTSLSQFPLLIHPTRKVQNSSLGGITTFVIPKGLVTTGINARGDITGHTAPFYLSEDGFVRGRDGNIT